jgi:hypothetical protein
MTTNYPGPVQIPSDATAAAVKSADGHSVTLTLPPVSLWGLPGQAVFVDGKLTTFTRPT